MTTQEIIDYYKGLLILQYRALTNAVSHVGEWCRLFLQDQVVSAVRDGFNVLTAIGNQLNILGEYRGINRTVFGILAVTDWSLVPYGDAAPNSYFGWAAYADADPSWRWLQYADLNSVPYTLSDEQMRLMIQLRAAFQSWDGSLGKLDLILYAFFGIYVNVVDNGNMTLTYQHVAIDPDVNKLWTVATTAGILPHGAGVSYTTVEV